MAGFSRQLKFTEYGRYVEEPEGADLRKDNQDDLRGGLSFEKGAQRASRAAKLADLLGRLNRVSTFSR